MQNITIKAASIVEPLGFSGSLPAVFFCVIYYVTTIQADKDVLFCPADGFDAGADASISLGLIKTTGVS